MAFERRSGDATGACQDRPPRLAVPGFTTVPMRFAELTDTSLPFRGGHTRPRERSTAAAIGDLPGPESRFAYGIKHLYAPGERWDLAVRDLPARLERDAQGAGCTRAELRSHEPSYHGACAACRAHVLRDHDRHLQPAYRLALATATDSGRCGTWADRQRPQEAFVGDNGVFVIARRARSGGPNVATAYRVVPRGGRPPSARRAYTRVMSDAAKVLPDDRIELGTEGELILPARLREALGRREGEPLRARIIGRGTLQVDTIGDDIRKARGMLRAHTGSRSLVDELEGERRREADRE
jgi:hypothetical protein